MLFTLCSSENSMDLLFTEKPQGPCSHIYNNLKIKNSSPSSPNNATLLLEKRLLLLFAPNSYSN